MAAPPSHIISSLVVYLTATQRPVTVLRPAVTENTGGDRMRGATSKKPGKRTEQSGAKTGIRPPHRYAKPN